MTKSIYTYQDFTRSHVLMYRDNICCFICSIEAWYEQELIQATTQTEYTVQFLLMELESVGNIRLEEGSSTDSWCLFNINIKSTTVLLVTVTLRK